MKILQLNFEKGWRGGERQTLYCMRAFRKAGHEVELMCRRGGPLAERARQEGFTVHECRNVPAQLRSWPAPAATTSSMPRRPIPSPGPC